MRSFLQVCDYYAPVGVEYVGTNRPSGPKERETRVENEAYHRLE